MLIMSSYNQKDFENKAKIKHGEKYDLSKAIYTNSRSKVTVICHKLDKNEKEHGEWMPQASNFLHGSGCPKCSREEHSKRMKILKRDTVDEFIEKTKSVHGDKYDYSKVEYINNSEKVYIICPEHGEFWQTPCDHKKWERMLLLWSIKKSKNNVTVKGGIH